MKNKLLLVIIALAICSIFTLSACGDKDTGTETDTGWETSVSEKGVIYQLDVEADNCIVIGLTDDADCEVHISSKYKGKDVVSIKEKAFFKNERLESITIPSSVASIGDRAFLDCKNLKTVEFEGKVLCKSIGEAAFNNCESIESIKIPETVEFIGMYAFQHCTSLISVELPSKITSISKHMFSKCESLKNITIPNGVTTIEAGAFSACTSLSSITMPRTIKSIGNNAFFFGCDCLESVNYLGSLEDWCNIEFEENPLWYGSDLYINGELMSDITIPATITEIKPQTFYGCTSLTSVTIGRNITSIGDYAFELCGNLKEINIPESVASIGTNAFYYCSSLTSVTIPSSVTSIENGAFAFCTNLTEINFNARAVDDLSEDNDVFYNAGQNGKGIKVTIGKEVTKIPAYLFYARSPYDFLYPSKITSVTFEEGSVCESIGNYAFEYCTSLTSIAIPNSVTSVASSAFLFCNSLTIYCEATEKPSGWSNSWNNSNLPVYWYSEEEPATSGNYWHYVDGVVTVWE